MRTNYRRHPASRTPRSKRRKGILAFMAALVMLATTACSSGGNANRPDNVITYWLWDSAQLPGYQQCADAFAQANPGLKVEITQMGWDNYWSKLTAGFIADQAPDVFTNHLNYFAQYADLGVLLPLDDLGPTKDIKDSDYQPGLAALWKSEDGKRYGVPKDWDTTAFFYDEEVMKADGISKQQLDTLTWNPKDGGTFEKTIAHLTIDNNGKRGDEAGFDKNSIKRYGFASNGSGAPMGQTQWGSFAGSIGGWDYADKNPWGTKFRYDDPQYKEMIAWYFGLTEKGYMAPYTVAKSLNGFKQIATQTAALTIDGSWMITSYQGSKTIKKLTLSPTPIGPSGKNSSPYNGLADSVTKFAKSPENAGKWVAFLGGSECQSIIAKAGVVFPARPEATKISADQRAAAGLDVSAFTSHLENDTTMLIGVTHNAADVNAVLTPVFDSIYIGTEKVSVLDKANAQINRILELGGG